MSEYSEYPYRSPELLHELYVNRQYTQQEIADELGCSNGVVAKYIQRHDIETRRNTWSHYERLKDKELLYELYVERELTTEEVGDRLGVTGWTISRWLDEFGIKTRNHGYGRGPDELNDPDFLREQYWDERKSTQTIADEIGASHRGVSVAMDRHGIDKRGPSERVSGDLSPMWDGGCTTYCGPNWHRKRREALERDGYTCQRCGLDNGEHKSKWGRAIEVHHIQRRESFRQDSGEIDWKNANRLENLITLCKNCHAKLEGLPIDNGG